MAERSSPRWSASVLLSVSSSPALKAPSATKSRATNTVAVSVLVGDGLICAITVGTKEGFGDGWLVGDVVGTGAGAAYRRLPSLRLEDK